MAKREEKIELLDEVVEFNRIISSEYELDDSALQEMMSKLQ